MTPHFVHVKFLILHSKSLISQCRFSSVRRYVGFREDTPRGRRVRERIPRLRSVSRNSNRTDKRRRMITMGVIFQLSASFSHEILLQLTRATSMATANNCAADCNSELFCLRHGILFSLRLLSLMFKKLYIQGVSQPPYI